MPSIAILINLQGTDGSIYGTLATWAGITPKAEYDAEKSGVCVACACAMPGMLVGKAVQRNGSPCFSYVLHRLVSLER